VITKEVDEKAQGIEIRYEIRFMEIGTEKDPMHIVVQSVSSYSPAQIVKKIKSITARKIFESYPEVKKLLWGGEFWRRGYYIGTRGEHGDKEIGKESRTESRRISKDI
jgi:REP element-mobilizing transposase RayT